MSNEQQKFQDAGSCELDEQGHCITCSDEAKPAWVLSVDEAMGTACVTINETETEIDITLVDDVEPGDIVLVHGGVAISRLIKHFVGIAGEASDA